MDWLKRIFFAPADEAAGGAEQETQEQQPAAAEAEEARGDQIPEGLTEGEVTYSKEDLEKAGIQLGTDVETGEPEKVDAKPTKGREPQQRQNRQPARQRINQLTGEKRELERRLADAELEKQRLVAEKADADRTNMVWFKAATKSNLEKAQRDLKDAKERGDIDAEVKAQTEVARYAGDMAQIENYEAANPPQQQQRQPQQQQRQSQPQQQQRQQAPKDPASRDWIANNDWFQADSDAFDPEMHDEAAAFASQLERRYTRAGTPEKIAGKEYFDQINKHMRAEFPDYDWGEDEPAPATNTRQKVPQMQGRDNVAQATRQAAPGNGIQIGATSTKVTLTPEQRHFAHQLPLKHANNKPYTNAEKERAYGLNLLRQQIEDSRNQDQR